MKSDNMAKFIRDPKTTNGFYKTRPKYNNIRNQYDVFNKFNDYLNNDIKDKFDECYDLTRINESAHKNYLHRKKINVIISNQETVKENILNNNNNNKIQETDIFLTNIDSVATNRNINNNNLTNKQEFMEVKILEPDEKHINFKEMIQNVAEVQKKIKSEYDELQLLIKYTKDTKEKISKHCNVVRKIFIKGNIPSKSIDDNLFQHKLNDNDYYTTLNKKGKPKYSKEKNMNVVADRLLNLQSNIINYHQHFNHKMSTIKESNRQHQNILLYKK